MLSCPDCYVFKCYSVSSHTINSSQPSPSSQEHKETLPRKTLSGTCELPAHINTTAQLEKDDFVGGKADDYFTAHKCTPGLINASVSLSLHCVHYMHRFW